MKINKKRDPKYALINKQKDHICDLYKNGLSLRKIGNIYNVSFKPILNVLKKNNLDRRQSKYTLDENYFEKIDTNSKAYILGLLYADGHVSNGNNFSICLQELDKHILDSINKLIGSDRILKFIQKPNEQSQNYYLLKVCNKKVSTDLFNRGVLENKDFIIKYPEESITDNLFLHFLRGYWDGDGYFSIDKRKFQTGSWAICSNKNFCEQIQSKLLKFSISSKIYQNSSRDPRSAELRVGSREEIIKIFELIYLNADLYLIRKYNKMKEFVSRSREI